MSKKKGHWPKGRTRSDLDESQLKEWAAIRRKLERLLRNPEKGSHPLRRSMGGLGEYLGVNSSTVSRWVTAKRVPMSFYYQRVVKWLSEVSRQK